MSEMDISERRKPQDGRMKIKVDKRTIDMRVSSIPTIFGEKIVLRILDASNLVLDFEN
jgi:type IV pilus assembly protein PilB